MKKFHFLTLALTLFITVSTLSGCQSDKTDDVGDSAAKVMEGPSGGLSEELAHHAYDTIFILSFATLDVGKEGNKITLTEEGNVQNYQFEDMNYLKDESGATVNGYMKSIIEETLDRSDVNLNFKNDPEGLETITIQSSGLPGETHNEGTLIINGSEKPFLEFVEYFASKFQQEVQPVEVSDTTPEN